MRFPSRRLEAAQDKPRAAEDGGAGIPETTLHKRPVVAAGPQAPRRPALELPSWAIWNHQLDQPYTLGIEEELMLLEPTSWSLAQVSDEVLPRLSDLLLNHASQETHAAVIELKTGIHGNVGGLVAELAWLRSRLAGELDAMGFAMAAAGTHAMTLREETRVSDTLRYRALNDSMRELVRREPTMAMHVHVGVPDPEDAIRLLNGLRRHLPILVALAANSPFWRGRDSGFASARRVIFQAFPRTGPPRCFADYADYVETVDALVGSGAMVDPSFLWWDVRLQPALGTVELRVMDAQSSVAAVAPLAALIQSLSRLELEGMPTSGMPSGEVLVENCFLAARDGMDARLIEPAARRLVPVRAMLDSLLADCHPHALALGCAGTLEQISRLAAANGAVRQREFVAHRPVSDLVASLAAGFLAPDWRDSISREEPRLTSVPTERSGACAAGSHTPVLPSS